MHAERHRFSIPDRDGTRPHRVRCRTSVNQQRDLTDARLFIDRKISEGKNRREARRAHKRHLANRVIRRMWKDESRRRERPVIAAA